MNQSREYRKWNQIEEDQLRTLASEGLSIRKIASILRRSYGSVYHQMEKLGLKRIGYYWSEEDEKLLLRHYPVIPPALLEKYSITAIKQKVLRMGLERKRPIPNFWSSYEEELLRKMAVAGLPAREIARLLRRSISSIYSKASKMGFHLNSNPTLWAKHPVAQWERFFDDLNNEPSAYWFGFLWADGYCGKDRVMLALSIKDWNHVIRFRRDIGRGSLEILPPTRFGKKGTIRVTLCSQHLIETLRRYGLETGRILPKIVLNDDSFRHFVRGFLDGDGSVRKDGRQISFCGPFDFLDWLAQGIYCQLRILPSMIHKIQNGKVFSLRYCKIKHTEELYYWLYSGVTRFLPRKYIRLAQRFGGVI